MIFFYVEQIKIDFQVEIKIADTKTPKTMLSA